MQGLGKGGGGGHGGGGHHGGGGGGHHGGGGRGRGGRFFRGGSPAYFAPGWGPYPYLYDDTSTLQVVVPESCEESVRSGCYQRWGHDSARMAQCVSDGYRGCGLKGFGALPGGDQKGLVVVGAVVVGAVAGYLVTKAVLAHR
jgi:hypothetical protein